MPWSRGCWRSKGSPHIPEYPDPLALRNAEDRLKTYPPLVFAGEIRQLKSELGRVVDGEGFLLQGGDCAETFADFNTFNIRDAFRVLLQMALILTFVGEKPVIKVGRVAGQFAKPRSNPTERTPEGEILTYRGDMINSHAPSGRTPDPERMIHAYFQSAATLNLLRAFAGGGYADINRASKWLLDFVDKSPVRENYLALARSIDKTIGVMRAYDRFEAGGSSGQPQRIDFYSSHEALFLPYEEALCRNDSLTGDPVAASAHFLWLGERTRGPEGPHAAFLQGVVNPIGIKCGPGAAGGEIERLLDKLNPDNEKGRITLILRAGVERAQRAHSNLIREMVTAGRNLVWCIDPMHGNPRTHASGVKTRHFADILRECEIFVNVCRTEGVHPGGLHLEMTGKNVSECLGGSDAVEDLSCNYETTCDPRLNASQALELAFAMAELLAKR